MILEKWPFGRKRAAKSRIFLFSDHSWLFICRKSKSAIFINVNLHVIIGVDPLSACANCISNPTLSFAQAKVELEGLNKK